MLEYNTSNPPNCDLGCLYKSDRGILAITQRRPRVKSIHKRQPIVSSTLKVVVQLPSAYHEERAPRRLSLKFIYHSLGDTICVCKHASGQAIPSP